MTTNKPEAAHLADAHAEFEAWASTHFFLQEEDTTVDDSYEYISCDMQLAWEAYQAGRAECEKLQAENAQLRAAIRRLCNMYEVDDYYDGQLREERLEASVNRAIDAAIDAAIEIREDNHD